VKVRAATVANAVSGVTLVFLSTSWVSLRWGK